MDKDGDRKHSDLYRVALGFTDAMPMLAPLAKYLPRIAFVVDSSALIADVRYLVSTRRTAGARTCLQEAIDAGLVKAYCPSQASDEVETRLHEIAENTDLPLGSLVEEWRRYSARIRFVRVFNTERPAQAAAALGLRDPSDLPFAVLQREVGAACVYTYDKDLIEANLTTLADRESVRLLRDYARLKGQATLMAGGFAGFVGLAGVGVGKAIACVPPPVAIGVGLGLATLLLHPGARRVIGEVLRDVVDGTMYVLDRAGEAELRSTELWARLKRIVPEAPRPTLRHAIRQCLIDSDHPLAATEIARRLPLVGYESDPCAATVRLDDTLRGDLCLSGGPTGWRLTEIRSSEASRPGTSRRPASQRQSQEAALPTADGRTLATGRRQTRSGVSNASSVGARKNRAISSR